MRKEFKIDEELRELLEYGTESDLKDYFFKYHLEDVNLDNIDYLNEQRNLTSSLDNAVYVLV